MNNKNLIKNILTILLSVLLITGTVQAVTTLSANIVTEGDLQVDGNTTLGNAAGDTIALTGLTTVPTTQKIQFRDTGLYINSSVDGQLDIVSDTTLAFSGAATFDGSVTLGDAVTDNITVNGQMASDLVSAAGTDFHYLKNSLTATSGEHSFMRVRGQSTAVGASTSDLRGLYAQGTTQDGLFGGTVTSIYANSIAKGTSTTVTLRGILIDTETENTPTSLTNMYGLYIRNKSTIAIGGDNYSIVIDNEKMGGGIVQDAGIQLKSTTWGADVTAWTYGIDMNQDATFGTADIRLSDGALIANGDADTLTITEATTALVGHLTVSNNVTLGDAITDAITLNSPMTSSLALTSASTSVNQLIATTTATGNGEFQVIEARGRSIATSASTTEVRGIYARATTNDNLYGGTITALQTETIAKGGSETVNLRGIFVAVDSENTPTAITNLYGAYIRTKTSVAPATDFYGLVIENETFGGGVAADAGILFKGTATGGFTYGIDINGATIGTSDIRLQNGETIGNGTDGGVKISGWVQPHTSDASAPSNPAEGALAVDSSEDDCTWSDDNSSDGGSLCVYNGAAWVVVATW